MFVKRIGSKVEVYHGTARMTPGGVTKSGIVHEDGRYKFKSKIRAARRNPALMTRARAVKRIASAMRRRGERPRGIIVLP